MPQTQQSRPAPARPWATPKHKEAPVERFKCNHCGGTRVFTILGQICLHCHDAVEDNGRMKFHHG